MAERPNYQLDESPEYSTAIPALIRTDPGDAGTFNRVFTALLNNTHFCKLLLDAVKQTAEAAIPAAQKGAANGVATLNGSGRPAQMPTAAEVGARPADWTPGAGDVGAVPVSRRVNGKELTGDISLTKSDVGLGSADNTRDADKRVSYADSAGSAGSAGYANSAGSAPANGGTSAACSGNAATATYATRAGTADNYGGYINAGRKAGTAKGSQSTAEGYQTTASEAYSHAEGQSTTASKPYSHAEGYGTTASNHGAHTEGSSTTASGNSAHAEGSATTASGSDSHAEGLNTTASGDRSHTEGAYTVASGFCSHAEGNDTTAKGTNSHAAGEGTIANDYQYVIGTFNVEKPSAGIYDDRFIIGGSAGSGNRRNCFRVHSNGQVYAAGAFNSTGADYAENFEWLDGNPEKEDRRGLFVTLDGEKIQLYASDDTDALGIISAAPSVLGDQYADQWQGMYETDVFGTCIYEDFIEEAHTDENGMEFPEVRGKRQKLNPNYDSQTPYTPRENRPEWSPVGMLGKLVVIDDGTCEVNGYCKPAPGGIGVKSEEKTRFRVMSRLDETHIRVFVQ